MAVRGHPSAETNAEHGAFDIDCSSASHDDAEQQAVWREPSDWLRETRNRGIVQCEGDGPFTMNLSDCSDERVSSFNQLQTPLDRPVSALVFSPSGSHLAIHHDVSSLLHVYSFPQARNNDQEIKLSAVIYTGQPLRDLAWSSKGKRLGIVTRASAIGLWDSDGTWEDVDGQTEEGVMEGVAVPNGQLPECTTDQPLSLRRRLLSTAAALVP